MDWIDGFMSYTDGIPSPEIFRLWSAIGCIAGALERRVWVRTARSALYPNTFILLVGAPGSGKTQAISVVEEMWYGAKKFHVAPNNVTKASLIDSLAKADTKIVLPSGLMEYHSLLVPAGELGVLIPAHDLEFLSVVNYVYDNPKSYREERRTNRLIIDITMPQLNILAGSQPGFLASLLPEEAWTMGFTSRMIMVYAAFSPDVSLFDDLDPRESQYTAQVKGLIRISALLGAFTFEQDALLEMERWRRDRYAPAPEHSKLAHYIPRRVIHVLKLSMISSASRGSDLIITLWDVNRARDWLLGAEQVMPDIFREMVQQSDTAVIQELHFYLWQLWTKHKKPIHESRVIGFLSNRAPSEKILRILEVAMRSGIIVSGGPQLYIPKPKHDWGVE